MDSLFTRLFDAHLLMDRHSKTFPLSIHQKSKMSVLKSPGHFLFEIFVRVMRYYNANFFQKVLFDARGTRSPVEGERAMKG